MKRITISLEDDLYRIAKAYALSEDISLSKAVTRLLRRGLAGRTAARSRVAEEPDRYRYVDAETGILISRGDGTIGEDSVYSAEEEEDERRWRNE